MSAEGALLMNIFCVAAGRKPKCMIEESNESNESNNLDSHSMKRELFFCVPPGASLHPVRLMLNGSVQNRHYLT